MIKPLRLFSATYSKAENGIIFLLIAEPFILFWGFELSHLFSRFFRLCPIYLHALYQSECLTNLSAVALFKRWRMEGIQVHCGRWISDYMDFLHKISIMSRALTAGQLTQSCWKFPQLFFRATLNCDSESSCRDTTRLLCVLLALKCCTVKKFEPL